MSDDNGADTEPLCAYCRAEDRIDRDPENIVPQARRLSRGQYCQRCMVSSHAERTLVKMSIDLARSWEWTGTEDKRYFPTEEVV